MIISIGQYKWFGCNNVARLVGPRFLYVVFSACKNNVSSMIEVMVKYCFFNNGSNQEQEPLS